MKTYTIAEAAQATGATPKALRRRVERGTIKSVLKDNVRRIPESELVRAGLLTQDGAPTQAPEGQGQQAPTPQGHNDVTPLVARIEELVRENAEFRQITQRAESLQGDLAAEQRARQAAEDALNEERAKTRQLEAQLLEPKPRRRRFFRRGVGERAMP